MQGRQLDLCCQQEDGQDDSQGCPNIQGKVSTYPAGKFPYQGGRQPKSSVIDQRIGNGWVYWVGKIFYRPVVRN